MAADKDDPQKDDEPLNNEGGESLSSLNTPKINPKTGKSERQAVASFKQAHSISKRLIDRAEEGRLKTAAQIADAYAGSPPYRPSTLESAGETWRHNFSTNPMASVVDRATPQLKDPIKEADSLTFSALPAQRDDANEKTRKFRRRTTKLIRSWPAWEDFVDQVIQDNYLYGNTAPAWIDDDWRPRAFRVTELFLPGGTGQHASHVQYFACRQPMLAHDFKNKIEDKEIAEAAGYNWDGCIKALDQSGSLRNGLNRELEFDKVDKIREGGSMETGYDEEGRIVWLYHLLVREYDGGVNLWTTSQQGGHPIRFQKGIHEKMEDSITLFTLQAGNGKFYGSKGAGRMLGNLHKALDRTRCMNLDKGYVAGLPIWQTKGDVNSLMMHMRGAFMVLTGEATLQQEMVMMNWESAQLQDQSLSSLMEAVAGAFIPPKVQETGSSKTTIEAEEKARRELAVRNGVLGRCFRHFGDLVSAMQRKIYKPENLKEGLRLFEESKTKQTKGIRLLAKNVYDWLSGVVKDLAKTAEPMAETKTTDADAVEAIIDLLRDGLTIEDIAELALSPAGNSIEEEPAIQDQKTTQFIAAITQSPLSPHYDQKKLAAKAATLGVSPDFAEEVLLKDVPDPTDQAYNQTEQWNEWMLMQNGMTPGVRGFDNHRVHRAALVPLLEPIISVLTTAPDAESLAIAKAGVQHFADHLAADKETPEAGKAEEAQSIEKMVQVIADAEKMLAQMAAQAAKVGAEGANAVPPPMMANGATITGVGPAGAVTQDPAAQVENDRVAADVLLRSKELEATHRKLDIEEQKVRQKSESEAQKLAVQTAKEAADKVIAAQQQGVQDAQMELIPPPPPAT